MPTTMDPIMGKLMGLRYKSHPWHGVHIGDEAPHSITCFIEMVSTDTVKYEVDKETGYLRIDRPQKYSTTIPALYGFIPQTYSGDKSAAISNNILNRDDIVGDGDPIDICVLTEKVITHGDILVKAVPIGGLRMIDRKCADDKIVCVLQNDAVYGNIENITDLPPLIIERLRHYFLTYKDIPGGEKRKVEITHVFNANEARELIQASMEDYQNKFQNIESMFGA